MTGNVEKKLVFVLPQKDVIFSPRTLWEAVEAAEKTPALLDGPSGKFETKPEE